MDYSTEGELLSVGDTARALGVSVDTVRRWEKDRKIVGHRTVGNQRRFPRREINRLLGVAEPSAVSA